MTVSQYDHVVPYTDLGGRGYLGDKRRSCMNSINLVGKGHSLKKTFFFTFKPMSSQ